MAKDVSGSAPRKQTSKKQGRTATGSNPRSKALEEATKQSIRLHRQALKELEKH